LEKHLGHLGVTVVPMAGRKDLKELTVSGLGFGLAALPIRRAFEETWRRWRSFFADESANMWRERRV